MKIGIDCRLWNESGVGRYIRNLVKNLGEIDRKNEYVLFVLTKDLKNIQFQISNFKFQIVTADVRWHSVEEQLMFPSILNKEKLDLVHFPYFSVPLFYTGKFVVTIHDLIITSFDTGQATTLPLPFYKIKRLGYKLVIRKAARRAGKIIAVSNSTKNDIVRFLGIDANKIVVTHEGIDEKISKINGKWKMINGKYFLYVGNAYPHKNLERLLTALNVLISQYPNIFLVLVGKEDYFYKRLKEKVKEMNLANNVIFYGETTDEELSKLYKNAKVLILPSLMEGFGLPALEAMANKCLVLASDIAAFREVCADAAIYFNPYEINDIAKKMKESLLNDFSKNIDEGLKRAKMFSWEKMAKETLKIYESCAGV